MQASSALNDVLSYNVKSQITASLAKGEYKLAFYLRNDADHTAQLANNLEYVNGYNVLTTFTVQ